MTFERNTASSRDHHTHMAPRMRRALPAGFFDPSDTGGVHRPYEPTPIKNRQFNPYYDEVATYQSDVEQALGALYDTHAPSDVPTEVQEMISYDRMRGETQRSIKTLEAYGRWGGTTTPYGDQRAETIHNEVERARLGVEHYKLLVGTITPHEVFSLLGETSLEAAELTRVSHPYGYRIEHVAAAREDVDEALLQQHGELARCDPARPYRDISLLPQHRPLDSEGRRDRFVGLMVAYKRTIGRIALQDTVHITVVERQSAALRIDEGAIGVDPKIAQVLRAPFEINGDWKRAYRTLDSTYHVTDYVQQVVQENTDEAFFVPLSTTRYAYKEVSDSTRYATMDTDEF